MVSFRCEAEKASWSGNCMAVPAFSVISIEHGSLGGVVTHKRRHSGGEASNSVNCSHLSTVCMRLMPAGPVVHVMLCREHARGVFHIACPT